MRNALTLCLLLAMALPDARAEQAHNHDGHDHNEMQAITEASGASLTRTDAIDAALAAGGEPIVADVLGVVCDFCATAMNKIFGKREEIAAVHVDLDTKVLSLVTRPGQSLSDDEIARLAEQAGYRVAAVRRNAAALGS